MAVFNDNPQDKCELTLRVHIYLIIDADLGQQSKSVKKAVTFSKKNLSIEANKSKEIEEYCDPTASTKMESKSDVRPNFLVCYIF